MYCDEKWYRPKKEMNLKEKEEGSQSLYRCKKKDKKLCEQIWKAYAPFTTPKWLQESINLGNEKTNASVGKYTPKTQTYGMTISPTNRVMFCADVSNIGAENNWNTVYSSLKIDTAHETTVFLRSQDQIRDYKKHYRSLTRVKIKRFSENTIKIKNLIEK